MLLAKNPKDPLPDNEPLGLGWIMTGAFALVLLIMTLVMFALAANAQQPLAPFLLEWVEPTTRTDGTALASDEIDSYDITADHSGGVTQTITVDAPATSVQWSPPLAGDWTFRIVTVDTQGNVGPFSDPLPVTHDGSFQQVPFDGWPGSPASFIGDVMDSVVEYVTCDVLQVKVNCRRPQPAE